MKVKFYKLFMVLYLYLLNVLHWQSDLKVRGDKLS